MDCVVPSCFYFILLNLATGSLSAEASGTFLINRGLFVSVVGVLRQEAVHEQKSVSTWTVNDSGPTVCILHLQDGRTDGWMVGFLFGWGGRGLLLCC